MDSIPVGKRLVSCLTAAIALSAHIGLQGDYYPVHPHLRCQFEKAAIGAYYNSEKDISTYLSYEIKFDNDLAVELGIVSGYTHQEGIVPFGRVRKGNVFITPAYESVPDNWGITLGYEFKFNNIF